MVAGGGGAKPLATERTVVPLVPQGRKCVCVGEGAAPKAQVVTGEARGAHGVRGRGARSPASTCAPRRPPCLLPALLHPPAAQGVEQETASPWHRQPAFGPFAFYDVAGRESVPPGGASIMNKAEAHMVRGGVGCCMEGDACAHIG